MTIYQANVEHFGEYNICKFMADYMHDSLSNGKFNNACLLYIMVIPFFSSSFLLCVLCFLLMWTI